MKFGGTSVADAERIKRAARRIVAAHEQNQRVVAVLSARGKTTDELISMAEEVSTAPDAREMDMLLSTGRAHLAALCARWPSTTSATRRSASRARRPASSPTRATPRPASSTCAPTASAPRSTTTWSCWSPGFRASRPPRTSPRWAVGGPTPRPSPSPPPSRPRCARSTPTSPACSRPTRGSSRTPASCRWSRSRRCSRCRPPAPASCSCAASSTRATTASASTAGRASRRSWVPSWSEKRRRWNDR